MKSILSRLTSILLTITLITICAIAVPITSLAAEYTFSGTISDKTTADTVYLTTSGGTVQIKLDATTELSGTKFLLPGNKITASCYTGSDEFWHASRISGSAVVGSASVDTSKTYTVSGTVEKGSNESTLFLKMSDGTMELKLDPTTDITGVRAITMGRKITVVCSRGSDAVMHALSISEGGTVTSTTTSAGTATTVTSTTTAPTSQVYTVSGTVDKATTTSVLYLNSSSGQYQMKIDPGATNSCHALIPGQSITASFYRGSDEWLHTHALANNSSKLSAATTLNSRQLTVSGTINGSTTESTLFLDTSGGTMQIRMDAGTNFSACSILIKGRSVEVVCQNGADEYLHAVSIAAK